jgi:hypothetical protein
MGQMGKTIELMGARGFALGQALLKDVRRTFQGSRWPRREQWDQREAG